MKHGDTPGELYKDQLKWAQNYCRSMPKVVEPARPGEQ